MNKIDIVFAGGRKLGVRVVEWLINSELFNISGICPLDKAFDPANYKDMQALIIENKLCVYSLEELSKVHADIGLSVNYNLIIPAEILSNFRMGFYNLHHSYNLRLRGRNITTHAILNARKENVYYHGTTLHKMVPKLDAGPIVATQACSINYEDTAYSLFAKVDNIAFELICEWLPRIATQLIFEYYPSSEGVHYYKNKDLPSKEINISELEGEEIYDYVRAFEFPPNEPVYFIKDGRIRHLAINSTSDYMDRIEIKGHIYYTEKE